MPERRDDHEPDPDDRTCGQVIHNLLAELWPEDPATYYSTTMRDIAAVATAAAREPG